MISDISTLALPRYLHTGATAQKDPFKQATGRKIEVSDLFSLPRTDRKGCGSIGRLTLKAEIGTVMEDGLRELEVIWRVAVFLFL